MTPEQPTLTDAEKQEAYEAKRREWREEFLRTRTIPPEDER